MINLGVTNQWTEWQQVSIWSALRCFFLKGVKMPAQRVRTPDFTVRPTTSQHATPVNTRLIHEDRWKEHSFKQNPCATGMNDVPSQTLYIWLSQNALDLSAQFFLFGHGIGKGRNFFLHFFSPSISESKGIFTCHMTKELNSFR